MKGVKHTLTSEQTRYIVTHFADTKNADILTAIGWPPNAWRSLRRVARRLGLTKSREFMAASQRNAADHAAAANRGEGNIGKLNLLKGAQYRFRKGENCAMRLGEEAERKRVEKSAAARRETVRKERLRIKWGLEQRTRLKLTGNNKQRTSRHALKRRGYIVSRGAKVIYYTDSTMRSHIVERNAENNGLTVKQAI